MKITIVVMDHQKNSKKKGENPKISVKNKGKIHKNGENRNFGRVSLEFCTWAF